MVKKTSKYYTQVLDILNNSDRAMSPTDIVFKILGTDNPKFKDYNAKQQRVRYHLKVLVDEGKVKKEKIKNGFVYSME